MILFGSPLLKFGLAGVLPANFASGGSFTCPIGNDADLPADANTEWLWCLLTPLVDASSGGVTTVNDLGGYSHVGASNGTWLQSYRGFTMPPTGAVTVYENTITNTVGSGAHNLAGANASQTASSSAGAVSQVHATAGAGAAQAASSGTGAVSQVHVLAGVGSSQAASSGTGVVSQVGVLQAAGTAQAATSAAGAVTQVHQLAGAGAAQAAGSGTGAASQVHQLAGAGASQAASSGTGAVATSGQLLGANASQAASSGTGAVSQVHQLAGVGSSQAASSGTGAVTGGPALVGANCSQAATSSASAVSQVHALAGANATQAAASAGAIVVQLHQLLGLSATQTASSPGAALTEGQDMGIHYASLQDMISRFGQDEIIQLTDRSPTATAVNAVVLEVAQYDADAEVNGYLARFALPLTSIPRVLVNIACDITRYRLYDDRCPEHVQKRYDAAVKLLDKISKGQLQLGLTLAETQSDPGLGPVVVTGGNRVFSRTRLADYSGGSDS